MCEEQKDLNELVQLLKQIGKKDRRKVGNIIRSARNQAEQCWEAIYRKQDQPSSVEGQ